LGIFLLILLAVKLELGLLLCEHHQLHEVAGAHRDFGGAVDWGLIAIIAAIIFGIGRSVLGKVGKNRMGIFAGSLDRLLLLIVLKMAVIIYIGLIICRL